MLEAGRRVIVTADFCSGSKTKICLRQGFFGTVKRVDGEGDTLVDFDKVDKMQWVRRGALDNVKVVSLEPQDRVIVKLDMQSDGVDSMPLHQGSAGSVAWIDKDGDALVDFDAVGKRLW